MFYFLKKLVQNII